MQLAKNKFSNQRLNKNFLNKNATVYNAVYGPTNVFAQYLARGSGNNRKKLDYANSVRNVHLIANRYLNNKNLNKGRWGNSPTGNNFKIHKPVPVIAFKDGVYAGHIWREGASPSNIGSDRALFIGIQKTLVPGVNAPKLSHALLKETERELADLGYSKIATFPRDVMGRIMNNLGNWTYAQGNNYGLRIKQIK